MLTNALRLPLVGNPNGCILDGLPGSSPIFRCRELLYRYGDLLPKKSTIHYYDDNGKCHAIPYFQRSSGSWEILDPSPLGEVLLLV